MFSGRFAFKVASVATLAVVLPLIIFGCSSRQAEEDKWPEGKPKVVVSFAPLYCFAVNVAGDDATVKNVMTTQGPHDFNPTEKEARLVSKADLFFVVGLGLDESKAEKMKEGASNKNLKIVELGEFDDIKGQLVEGHCEHEEHEKDDPNHKHDKDPHVWLSPDHAILIVNHIRDELSKADPAHKAGYEQRAAAYIEKLKKLKADGQALLKDKKEKRLVSFHDSLSYFAKCFNLEISAVLTQKPGVEPTAKQLEKIIQVCTNEKEPTRIIAVEPQYSTSNSGESLKKELIAKKVDAELVEIDTLETVKPGDLNADWYETKMRANLEALSGKLK